MSNKEFLLYLSLSTVAAIGLNTKGVGIEPIQDKCQAITVENPMVLGGLTLPLSIGGETSIIFLHDKAMLPHEREHGSQICEMGSWEFIKEYIGDPEKYEKDADARMRWRMR